MCFNIDNTNKICYVCGVVFLLFHQTPCRMHTLLFILMLPLSWNASLPKYASNTIFQDARGNSYCITRMNFHPPDDHGSFFVQDSTGLKWYHVKKISLDATRSFGMVSEERLDELATAYGIMQPTHEGWQVSSSYDWARVFRVNQ